MTLDVKKVAAVLQVSEELLGDWRPYMRAMRRFAAMFAYHARRIGREMEDAIAVNTELAAILKAARAQERKDRRMVKYNTKMSRRAHAR